MFGLGKKRNMMKVAEYRKYNNSATFIICLVIIGILTSIILFKTVGKPNTTSPQFNEKKIQEYVEL